MIRLHRAIDSVIPEGHLTYSWLTFITLGAMESRNDVAKADV